jgi:hypothetical protein
MEYVETLVCEKIGQSNPMIEHPSRIEPCRLDEIPPSIADLLTQRITHLPERSARRILSEAIDKGLLASDLPKGNLHLRFPASTSVD